MNELNLKLSMKTFARSIDKTKNQKIETIFILIFKFRLK